MKWWTASGSFLFGFAFAVFLCGILVLIDADIRNQRLIDNGYAHYDTKTAEFIFHEKEKP